MTWRFAVDEFDWGYRFTNKEGLKIEMVKGYGDSTVTYQKFQAIKVGVTTRKDLETLFKQGLRNNSTSIEYFDPTNGKYEIVSDNSSDGIGVMLNPKYPDSPDQVVIGKSYSHGGYYDQKEFEYPQVTEENFYKLEENMSYESVSAILGGEGLLHGENSTGNLTEQNYTWFGRDPLANESHMYLQFKKVGNEFVLTDKRYNIFYEKARSEYKEFEYPQVTEENFHKLEENMNYESVSAILGGEGALTAEEWNNQEEYYRSYKWFGTDEYSRIFVYFKKVGNDFVLTDKSIFN